jgi:sugar/nucleoside kinase (ribokinase family)
MWQGSRLDSQNPHSAGPTLTFIGHVSIDEIENTKGTKTQPGGGALYSAMAAKTQNVEAAIVSAVGKDYPFKACFNGIDSTCVRTLNMPTTRFHIRYDKNWEANYVKTSIGAGARINASLIPSRLLKPQSIIHLSPMKPPKAAKIAGDIKKRSPDVRLSTSAWIGYMKTQKERKTLAKLASQVDFFMLNEFEAKALTQTNSLSLALERIKTRNLIVTMGKLGAIVSSVDSDPQMVPALANPTGKIVDTTGAGDVWNGAFLASYSVTNDLMKAVTAASIISSIKCSQWGFKAIQKLAFKKPLDAVEYVLALKEGNMQRRITDFSQLHKSQNNSARA